MVTRRCRPTVRGCETPPPRPAFRFLVCLCCVAAGEGEGAEPRSECSTSCTLPSRWRRCRFEDDRDREDLADSWRRSPGLWSDNDADASGKCGADPEVDEEATALDDDDGEPPWPWMCRNEGAFWGMCGVRRRVGDVFKTTAPPPASRTRPGGEWLWWWVNPGEDDATGTSSSPEPSSPPSPTSTRSSKLARWRLDCCAVASRRDGLRPSSNGLPPRRLECRRGREEPDSVANAGDDCTARSERCWGAAGDDAGDDVVPPLRRVGDRRTSTRTARPPPASYEKPGVCPRPCRRRSEDWWWLVWGRWVRVRVVVAVVVVERGEPREALYMRFFVLCSVRDRSRRAVLT